MPPESTTIETGKLGEDIACEYLSRKGFTVVARNFRDKTGEIDIIAEKDNVIHVVEVKALACSSLKKTGGARDEYRPEEQAHPTKLRKVARTAELYMAKRKDNREYQVDVIAVLMDAERRIARCRFYEQVL